MAIHVPFYDDGTESYVTSEWHRALVLLRDSFQGRFDRFIVVAPRAPADLENKKLVAIGGLCGDGFDVRPSVPLKASKREYWLRDRRRWLADVGSALKESEVAHMNFGDLYRPFNMEATRLSLNRGTTTVFVCDTDAIAQNRHLVALDQMRSGPDRRVYEWIYERMMRRVVSRAHLSLLKGLALYERYGAVARNARIFQDTSYSQSEIVPRETVERRLATLSGKRPVRFVYCGRLVGRKGLDHAIRMIAGAAAAGADVALDLIGDGPDRAVLSEQAVGEGVGERVNFLGARPYGPELISELAGYDALLFTPLAEDTPRMIFDGYAAGLPLVAYDIPYVRERATEEGAAITIPTHDVQAGTRVLIDLDRNRGLLRQMAPIAHAAAQANSAESWYRRRAEWTLEAHERHLSGS